MIHAGAVRMDDLALLIPSGHDRGKSSLSLGIGQIGSFYSDDVTPIDPATVTPRPFPRELVLHSGWRIWVSAIWRLPRPAVASTATTI